MKHNKRGKKSTHQFVLSTRRNPTEEDATGGILNLPQTTSDTTEFEALIPSVI